LDLQNGLVREPQKKKLLVTTTPGSVIKRSAIPVGALVMFPDDILFCVTIRELAWFCTMLTAGAFLTCVALAVSLHFEGSTKTHCNVPNFLPSISAAIGDFTPERYIWRFCIGLHCFPRLMSAFVYKNFYLRSPLRPSETLDEGRCFYVLMCWLICVLHLGENLALLSLSFVSSTENHAFHEMSFITFVILSQLYIVLTLYMFRYSGRQRASSQGHKSYQTKQTLFVINICALLASVYFFVRHNRYCEPGVYTIFAFCEYVVVLSNIGFHATIAIDMSDRVLAFTAASTVGLKEN